jgi:EAL domain-containing protein (putative c-di-GMP-specific phosphodiesterase class I)
MFEGVERSTYQPGDLIFQEGSEGDCAYLIESGKVEISILRDNRHLSVCILGEGDLFGEMALIDNDVRTASAKAIEETCLIRFHRDLIETKLTKVDPVIKYLLHLVLKRFRNMHYRLSRSDLLTPEIEDIGSDDDLSSTQQNMVQHIRIGSDIKGALTRDEFLVYYQPIIAIKHGQLAGFEALIRWEHPEYGLVAPNQFLGVLEDTGLIYPVSLWIAERACRDLETILKEYHKNTGSQASYFVAINLSANQLVNAEHMAQLANIFHSSGIDPAYIKLEVTETVMIEELEQARQVLFTFRDQGFRVSLDDFGTGYSSLSHLQKFPVDDIKIDRSFISRMFTDNSSMQIVRAAIDLAKTLDLGVVAEGAENKEDVDQLIELGCSYCQGYYFAKPLSLAETLEYIKK